MVPESVKADLRWTIQRLADDKAKVRIIRIHFEDFKNIMDRLVSQNPYMPFMPTLLGVPVDIGTAEQVEVVAVRDDDTNTGINLEGKQTWQL